MTPAYDRELIADMLESYGWMLMVTHGLGGHTTEAVAEQIRLLREANNAEAAKVGTADASEDGLLRKFADAVEALAFKMPPPNEWTPQFVQLAIEARCLAASGQGVEGMALVPVVPTEQMTVAGFESDAWDRLSDAAVAAKGWPYSCRESAECVQGIYRAMLAAAPTQEKAL